MDVDEMIEAPEGPPLSKPSRNKISWVWWLALVAVIAMGAYFRYIGMDWDENHHLHPDERFLTMVSSAIEPVDSVSDYFNTHESSLNPNNRGYGFYVYGTLPLFIVRYLAEWLEYTGYGEVYLVGRYTSATIDMLTVFLVFLISFRLYRDMRLSVLATAFSACSVMQIQISHYYTVDNFTTFFSTLTLFFAVWVMTARPPVTEENNHQDEAAELFDGTAAADETVGYIQPQQNSDEIIEGGVRDEGNTWWVWLNRSWVSALPYMLFGLALGLSMASKVNAAPLAILLPAAAYVYYQKNIAGKDAFQGWLDGEIIIIFRNLVIAAIISFIVFRVFQPYAFDGPGLFNVSLNPKWVSTMEDIQAQSAGDVDFPPALQWARRPLWFAWDNMVQWGLGLPLGLLAWAAFLWMAWLNLKGEWKQHGILWGWTALYFGWQSLNWTSSMRYMLLVYPTLAIIAAWGIIRLYDQEYGVSSEDPKVIKTGRRFKWYQLASVVLGVVVLSGTIIWAYSFSRIYARPMTRVDASRWVYQNVPTAINVKIETTGGKTINHPLSYKWGVESTPEQPVVMAFEAAYPGSLNEVQVGHVAAAFFNGSEKILRAQIFTEIDGETPLAHGLVINPFNTDGDPRGNQYTVTFDYPLEVLAGEIFYLRLDSANPEDNLRIAGAIRLGYVITEGSKRYQFLPEPVMALREGQEHTVTFSPLQSGYVTSIEFPHVVDWEWTGAPHTLLVSLMGNGESASVELVDTFLAEKDWRGKAYQVELLDPLPVSSDEAYVLRLVLTQGEGALGFYGSKQANESTWDDVIPLGMDGFSPFDYNNGLYRTDLNFEMYWDDNEDKRQRFIDNLDQADYLFITSNRQWGTTVRVPERYPLTSSYYRNLIGCPEDKEIIWCYSVAEPGMMNGSLGFELHKVFQSDPSIGPFKFNTQFAEEAFTVYDHPKVLIFKKTENYDSDQVRKIFASVNLDSVVRLTPRKTPNHPATLILPLERLAQQREGGTWSELFNTGNLMNRYPVIGLVVWYFMITLLGWIVYPTVRLAFRGLTDKGYPLARLVALVLLAFLSWVIGSAGLPVSRMTILLVVMLLAVANFWLFWLQRTEMIAEWKSRRKYFLFAEGLMLAFFVLFLLVRLGNPDLWHPYKGGEKPMDFSYLNAVIKSTTFPPYDPWFSGGYINYYYYGFVLIGMPIKLLGIVPSIAYNLVLPSLFAFFGMGAFSIGWNLWSVTQPDEQDEEKILDEGCAEPTEIVNDAGQVDVGRSTNVVKAGAVYAGLTAAVFSLILGNLGTVRMIWYGFQKLVAPGGDIDGAGAIQRWIWAFKGVGKFIEGAALPYRVGDWYWIPSRVFPAEPITEFPAFTFLYADPHAHMIALPVTILVIAWCLSMLLCRSQWQLPAANSGRSEWLSWLHFGITFLVGGLLIGALRPTNTWDFPVYLVLGVLAVIYATVANPVCFTRELFGLPEFVKRWLIAVLSAALLAALAFLLYKPFSDWYGAGYTAVNIWEGDRSPFWSYLTHWGLFLFAIVSWLVWESIDWMKKTPLSVARRLKPFAWMLQGSAFLLVVVILILTIMGINVAWVVLLVGAWAAVLMLRPGQPDAKRMVLFMVGTGLVLTLTVEVIVLKGDIGRMNTVFKFYLQAWTLLSISAAAGLVWLFPVLIRSRYAVLRISWQVVLAFLVFSAALFPFMGGADKIRDRMASNAPHTLDGMNYMQSAVYSDQGVDMDLRQDYEAIRWMQENVEGSPVIVEAHVTEYRWGSRFTIYTGLPGVVGWNWHQRQQRGVASTEWVTNRVEEIGQFYRATDRNTVEAFLAEYDVSYIIVGQQEKAYYSAGELAKFPAWEGDLWDQVYSKEDTVIYQVRTK
jgi:YYY domain-containing protein